jgi:hypothetical protein
VTHAARCGAAVVIVLGIVPGRAAAQDTTAVDPSVTLERDSLPAEIVPATPTLPLLPEVPIGPLAPGSRYVFTRDSILWSSAITLADLLAEIPGVFVARTGVFGQPEYVQYGGRGGSSLEIYWDGARMTPLGADSLFHDPTLVSLRYVRQVDVEVLPSVLHVYLASERHEAGDARSTVRVMAGAFQAANYSALFQKRTAGGISLDLAADFLGTDGASGAGRTDHRFDVWGRVGWMPTERVDASYQVRRSRMDRGLAQTGTPARAGLRTDHRFQLTVASAPAGRGARLDAGLLVSSWAPDSGSAESDQHERRVFTRLAVDRPDLGASLGFELGDRWTPWSADARAGWVPVPGIVLAGQARTAEHKGGRSSQSVQGSLGVYRGPFSLSGELAVAKALQAPALAFDTAVVTRDEAVRFGVDLGPLLGTASLVRRDGYDPYPYPELVAVGALGRSEPATYLVADATLGPFAGWMLTGWYSDPLRGGLAALQPPKHGRFAVTFRSKFWRTFRSGAFDLQVRFAVESWSTGVAGVNNDGTPIVLPGATFIEYHIAFQLLGFTAFWDLRNGRLSDAGFVPGIPYPKNAQTFGVTWRFAN